MSADHERSLVSDLQRLGARLLAQAAPVTTDEIVGDTLRAVPGEPLLNSRPVAARRNDRADGAVVGAGASRSRRAVGLIGGIAATSLLVGGLAVVNRRGTEPDPDAVGAPAPAESVGTAAAMPTATASQLALSHSLADLSWPPRLLLGDTWEIVSVDERSVNEGYLTFRRDGTLVSVGWYRGEPGPDKGLTEVGSATLLGQTVPIYGAPLSYSSTDISELIDQGLLEPEGVLNDFVTDPSSPPGSSTDTESDLVGGQYLDDALADAVAQGLIEPVPSSGPEATLEWDGSSISVAVTQSDSPDAYDTDAFATLLESVGHTDAAVWEQALPDRVVTPAERRQVVDGLLAGVPVPDDFSPVATVGRDLVRDRANLAGELQQHIACAWLDRYFSAEGEGPEADAALEAIATMPDWPVTRELSAELDDLDPGVIFSGRFMAPLTVNDDGTITVEDTGELLDGYVAARLCDSNAVG